MKTFFSLTIILFFISCEKKMVVKHKMPDSTQENLTGIKVINSLDPVCNMTTKDFLKDTLHLEGKVYGFCSPFCKEEFSKNPSKYEVE